MLATNGCDTMKSILQLLIVAILGCMVGQAPAQLLERLDPSITESAVPAADEPNNPFREYDQQFIAALQRQWDRESALVSLKGSGLIRIQFRLHPHGAVSDIGVIENDLDQDAAIVCIRSVSNAAPFLPFPPELGKLFKGGARDARISFNIESGRAIAGSGVTKRATKALGNFACAVQEFGVFQVESNRWALNNGAVMAKPHFWYKDKWFCITNSDEKIPAILNTRFGVIYQVTGLAPGARTNAVHRVRHPEARRPDGTTTIGGGDWRFTLVADKNGIARGFIVFTFEAPHELASGTWAMGGFLGDKLLFHQLFTVVTNDVSVLK